MGFACWSRRLGGICGLGVLLALGVTSSAAAQDRPARRFEVRFTPAPRAQVAIWVESADGQRFQTLGLTESVSYRGIGNRPGALQMNSGYRWPYGRREGVLPVWAHRRVDAGGDMFRTVIFNGRVSEGNASSAGSVAEPINTRDDYYCLSFDRDASQRDALDAVTCASIFNSNKGRYVTGPDVSGGYAEPFEEGEGATMRGLEANSYYPPRRDVTACTTAGCGDHADVGSFSADARAAMPEIDAVTMASMAGGIPQLLTYDVPDEWPDGEYVLFIEVNVEGDYNGAFNDAAYPTPVGPDRMWDYWAVNYGYAYRGQPSVVYEVPFEVLGTGGAWDAADPAGYGEMHGADGDIRPLDASISNDAAGAPGSGADRLNLVADGYRVEVTVPPFNVCDGPNPPAACGRECEPDGAMCGDGLVCGDDFTCVGICDVQRAPSAVPMVELENYPEESNSHRWAVLRFQVPESERGILRYEVRYSLNPIVDAESFERALPAVEAAIENLELLVEPADEVGREIEVEIGGMSPESTYYVAVRAIDECNAPGEFTTAEIQTTAINFTTVSPCFVATAAYGSALEPRIGSLRRFRDRHLMTNPVGRALVGSYHQVGPVAAGWIGGSETLRGLARTGLSPIVQLAELLD